MLTPSSSQPSKTDLFVMSLATGNHVPVEVGQGACHTKPDGDRCPVGDR